MPPHEVSDGAEEFEAEEHADRVAQVREMEEVREGSWEPGQARLARGEAQGRDGALGGTGGPGLVKTFEYVTALATFFQRFHGRLVEDPVGQVELVFQSLMGGHEAFRFVEEHKIEMGYLSPEARDMLGGLSEFQADGSHFLVEMGLGETGAWGAESGLSGAQPGHLFAPSEGVQGAGGQAGGAAAAFTDGV